MNNPAGTGRRFAALRASTAQFFVAALLTVLLSGCAGGLKIIEHPSPNKDDRVRFLVLHFTDEKFSRSLEVLTDPRPGARVSAHYLVSAPGDPAPAPRVYRLVQESQRAWHAGESQWQGRHALNDQSIGIEIVYESHCPRPGPKSEHKVPPPDSPSEAEAACAYGEYAPAQIDVVRRLARDVLSRHPQIDPTRIVGHSDIAPTRKPDPGPRFPWRALHDADVGAWYDEADVERFMQRLEAPLPRLPELLQEALAAYGYGVETSGDFDGRSRDVVFAFQTHFLPDHRTGTADARTAATALALLAKYRPTALAAIAAKYGIVAGP